MTKCLFAGILLCLCTIAPAQSAPTTYVVAQNSPAASNANPGTANLPLKTIAKAAEILRPGDTVIIHAGVYREYILPHRSGQPNAPITYTAALGERVVITGADPITDWQKEPGPDPIYRVPWTAQFIIDHDKAGNPIEQHPQDAPLWGRAEQVIADGKQLCPELTLQDLRNAWYDRDHSLQPLLPNLGPTFAGAFTVDTHRRLLWIWLADGSNPNSHAILAATRPQCFGANQWQLPQGLHFIHINGIIFQYAASFPQRPAVDLTGSQNLVENCTIQDMAGSGISLGGTLRNCIVRNCGHTGGAAENPGFLNENCLWEGNSWKPLDRGWDSAGVKIAQTSSGIFRHCLFRRNGGAGLWFDINVHNVTVTHCVFAENELSGLFIEISRDNTVDHCLAIRNGIGIVGDPKNSWGIGGFQLGEAINCTLTHNTSLANPSGISLREQGPRLQNDIPYHLAGNTITNNLCADNTTYQLAFWYDNAFFGMHPNQNSQFQSEADFDAYMRDHHPDEIYNPTKQNMTIDYNVYGLQGQESLILYGVPWRSRHQEFNSLQDFNRATQWDAHSQIADPTAAKSPDAGWAQCPADLDKWLNLALSK